MIDGGTALVNLRLPLQCLHPLLRAHISSVGEVLAMSDEELLRIRRYGEKRLAELDRRLAELNLKRGE